jgi:hypothetical protein
MRKRRLLSLWTLVADEKPDADTTVLMCRPDWIEPVELGSFDGEIWRDSRGRKFREAAADVEDQPPLYWMHMPEPPAA